MWRPAEDRDLEWMERFLREHIQSSMFLLGNLRDYGLGSDAPYGMRVWVLDGLHPGVIGITNSGTVMPQAPRANECEWRAAAALFPARAITGVLGDAPQARQFLKFAGQSTRSCEVNRDEAGFRLPLADLQLPALENAELRPLSDAPPETILSWRAAYNVEILGASQQDSHVRAEAEVAKFIKAGSHWALFVDGVPVSMCGVNAHQPDVVQVGAVFTPPQLRGRGYARSAVAQMLQKAHQDGARDAVLFAASAAAGRAYQAIGFEPAGSYALVQFAKPAQNRTNDVETRT